MKPPSLSATSAKLPTTIVTSAIPLLEALPKKTDAAVKEALSARETVSFLYETLVGLHEDKGYSFPEIHDLLADMIGLTVSAKTLQNYFREERQVRNKRVRSRAGSRTGSQRTSGTPVRRVTGAVSGAIAGNDSPNTAWNPSMAAAMVPAGTFLAEGLEADCDDVSEVGSAEELGEAIAVASNPAPTTEIEEAIADLPTVLSETPSEPSLECAVHSVSTTDLEDAVEMVQAGAEFVSSEPSLELSSVENSESESEVRMNSEIAPASELDNQISETVEPSISLSLEPSLEPSSELTLTESGELVEEGAIAVSSEPDLLSEQTSTGSEELVEEGAIAVSSEPEPPPKKSSAKPEPIPKSIPKPGASGFSIEGIPPTASSRFNPITSRPAKRRSWKDNGES